MEEERVREKIARHLWVNMHLASEPWGKAWDWVRGVYLEYTDQILAIKGIRIEADDQSLPANIYDDNQYGIAQQDMLKAGFVKVLPKKE